MKQMKSASGGWLPQVEQVTVVKQNKKIEKMEVIGGERKARESGE